jgi:hypothetical protein
MERSWLQWKNTRVRVVCGQAILLLSEPEKGDSFADAQLRASPIVKLAAIGGHETFHGGKGVKRGIGPGGVDLLHSQFEGEAELLVGFGGVGC